jgi:transcriptional regulator with XRE-family HTH domain
MVEGWGLLAARIAAERSRRRHSRAAFAKAAGVSVRVVDDLERGRRDNYSDATLAAVEAALGWEFGSAMRVVSGGRPHREMDPYLAQLVEVWPSLSPDARAMLARLAEYARDARLGL